MNFKSLLSSLTASGGLLFLSSHSLFAQADITYEGWKIANAIPVNLAATSDSDHDGVPLLLEYAFGLDPSAPSPAPDLGAEIDPISNEFSVTYARLRCDLIYEVEGSRELQNWSDDDIAAPPVALGEDASASVSLNHPSNFLRLKVTLMGHATPQERIDTLLSQRFGFGAQTTGGAQGVMTLITDLTDNSLLTAITDNTPRWIYFHPCLDGETWLVPSGSTAIGKNKTIDGRNANITWQYGFPNNDLRITQPPVITPVKTGQLNAQQGELILAGITHVGDLGWPYIYESPYFKNGATDGLEIWGGSHYWIHDNTWKRMSDESLGAYHLNGGIPDLITFSKNTFFETKTASLVGNGNATGRGRITIAHNLYNTMVNGRSPGEIRNMDAHIYNNVVGYMNDEGLRVGKNGRVISEGNVFDMGCNPAVSGPRVIRYVLPAETPLGVLYSEGDIVSAVSSACPFTLDQGFITAPAAKPFTIPYQYNLLGTRAEILDFVGTPN